ncbi:MAG TPA: DUF2339 domain-containing protein, partial [Pyrinomonadaceae bacterium]|nr:DUF2339 domain-containing protein [Pyrinomonadaceae bacterium]
MPEQPDPKIKELEDRLDRLVRTQIDFQNEISAIRKDLIRLNARKVMAPPPARDDKEALYARLDRTAAQSPVEPPTRPTLVPPSAEPAKPPVANPPPTVATPSDVPPPPRSTPPPAPSSSGTHANRPPGREAGYQLPKRTPYVADPVLSSATTSGDAFSRFVSQYSEKARENLEEFVGKNLISLIGIVVLILGVGIGAKYAIDNNFISPLTRIIVGYIFGFGLVGLAIKLKKNYHNFSSVLISGGMAIMYFVTYFAYSSYGLIGQLPTFGLMIMFTAGTVTAALIYSRQVIAHIGLVGAYAVPFLLSTDSGNYLALFIYMAVINTGILVVSVLKEWKPIFYTASVFTWAIFCGWYATKYTETHFDLALIFLAVFFLIFYAVKLVQAYLLKDDEDPTENAITSVFTVAVFYAMCFAMTVGIAHGPLRYWTLFTYLAAASAVIVATSLRFFREPITFYAS